MSAAVPLFTRYPLRAENLRARLQGRRRIERVLSERLQAVRFELFGWAQWRAGYDAGKGGIGRIDLDEPDRVRSIATAGDSVRFYLATVEGVGWEDVPIRQRWTRLYRLYRLSYRSRWAAEGLGDLRRRMMALLVDEVPS